MNKEDARDKAAPFDDKSAKGSTTADPAPAVERDPCIGVNNELKDNPRKPKGTAAPKRKKRFVL
jgi:hypothetical protein